MSAQSIYNACANNSGSDFTDQVVSQQASCLCYEQFGSVNQTTSWVPGVFDGFVSLCDEFVATQTVVSVSATVTGAAVTGATGVCKGVGDVRASASASVAAATSSSTPAPSPIVPPTSSGGRSRERGMGYRGMLLVLGAILGWIRM